MKATPLGAFLANILSGIARVLGVVIYYTLRVIYRPRDRAIAVGIVLLIAAVIALLVWRL